MHCQLIQSGAEREPAYILLFASEWSGYKDSLFSCCFVGYAGCIATFAVLASRTKGADDVGMKYDFWAKKLVDGWHWIDAK
jgi:hypothetical protein